MKTFLNHLNDNLDADKLCICLLFLSIIHIVLGEEQLALKISRITKAQAAGP
jgi:hypothetical protein